MIFHMAVMRRIIIEIWFTMPTWLAGRYQYLCECLIDKIKKSMSSLPQYYQHNSFYNEVNNLYLAMKSTFQLSTSLFHQSQFFIWLLHVLVDKIPCLIYCKDDHQSLQKSPGLQRRLNWSSSNSLVTGIVLAGSY